MKKTLFIILPIMFLFISLAHAQIVIGSEMWGQSEQSIKITQNSDRFIFEFCLNKVMTRCHFLHKDPRGLTSTQLESIQKKLFKESISISRNKPILYLASVVAILASTKMGLVLGSTFIINASNLISSLSTSPEWQAENYIELSKELNTKNGNHYVPDIVLLAQELFNEFQNVGAYEVICGCQIFNSGSVTNYQISGIGKPGLWAAKMNAENSCRELSRETTNNYQGRILLSNCITKNQIDVDFYECNTDEFCH